MMVRKQWNSGNNGGKKERRGNGHFFSTMMLNTRCGSFKIKAGSL
jgi:hypothetical protein